MCSCGAGGIMYNAVVQLLAVICFSLIDTLRYKRVFDFYTSSLPATIPTSFVLCNITATCSLLFASLIFSIVFLLSPLPAVFQKCGLFLERIYFHV